MLHTNKPRLIIKRLILGFFLFLLLTVGWLISWSTSSVSSLKSLKLNDAANRANQALVVLQPINNLLALKSKDLVAWQSGLELVSSLADWQNYLDSEGLKTQDISQIKPSVDLLNNTLDSLDQLSTDLPSAFILKSFVPNSIQDLLTYWQLHKNDLRLLVTDYILTDHKVLLLFQNSHELRATGGFMGSYALLEISQGKINSWVVEDIYDADGQFSGLVEAPPGVKEYLSSTRGMRLPDSNWQPEFDRSAQQVLQYFALGNRQDIDTVVAINHSALEKLLEITGPVYLPDYHTTITDQTAVNLLENRPGTFFAGSQLKKHLISQLFTQMIIKLEGFSVDNWQSLIQLLPQLINSKDLQIYSIQPQTQQLLSDLGLTATWMEIGDKDIVGWVESNVGINKVNQYITRSLELELDQYQTLITASFENIGDRQYVNYQRLYLPQNWQIVQLADKNKEIVVWHEDLIELSNGETVKEVGFLMLVPAMEKQTISITIDRRQDPLVTNQQLYLPKQSGLPPLPVTIIKHNVSSTLLLESDTVL